jgi:uncharacterized metal-binding protein
MLSALVAKNPAKRNSPVSFGFLMMGFRNEIDIDGHTQRSVYYKVLPWILFPYLK